MKFKKAKCKVLHVYRYKLRINGLKVALQRTWLQVDEIFDVKTATCTYN